MHMITHFFAGDELGQLLGELVTELESSVLTIQQGINVFSGVLEGGTANVLLAVLTDFALRLAAAGPQYVQLQMEWMLAGY